MLRTFIIEDSVAQVSRICQGVVLDAKTDATGVQLPDVDSEPQGATPFPIDLKPAGAGVKVAGGAGGKAPAGYVQLYANVSSWVETTCCKKSVGWFVAGECDNGHRFAKTLVCNKEWCEVCGEEGSVAHKRRWVRWLPKINQMGSMGVFTFTMPLEVRDSYRTKKRLSQLGHGIQERLKELGYYRGLRRWHWFGDLSGRYHPHLNCLVDGGFVSKGKLEAIKRAYAGLLGVDLADVHYHYRRSPGEMIHSLKYTTRATFLDCEWDLKMAMELRGFRNMVVWGRGQWADLKKNPEAAVWTLADLKGKAKAEVEGLDIESIDALAQKTCPVCGEAVSWGEALPIGLLNMVQKQDLGAGYYRLADLPPPRGLPENLRRILSWKEAAKKVSLKVTAERAAIEAEIEAEYQANLWRDLLVAPPCDPPARSFN